MQKFENRRQQFPSIMQRKVVYFDGPGGTQVPESVIRAVTWYYETCNANTHGLFAASIQSDEVIQKARSATASFLNAPSSREISFGANMTTLNFALSHAIGKHLQPGEEVVITQLDHEANRGPWLRLRSEGIVVKEVRLKRNGTLDYDDFQRQVGPQTRVVAAGFASNALGTVNDIPLIRRISRASGAWLVVDAVHAAPHFPTDVQALDADFLLCSAYKFYGPHVGVLYTRPNLLDQLETDRLATQDAAGPTRIETGTLNHAALCGVTAAIEFIATFGRGVTFREQIVNAMERITAHERRLASRLYDGLARLEGVTLYGPPFEEGVLRAPTVSFTTQKLSSSEVARALGVKGFQVWDGDFYAARAVELFGLRGEGGLVRVGMSLYNTETEVDQLLESLTGLLS